MESGENLKDLFKEKRKSRKKKHSQKNRVKEFAREFAQRIKFDYVEREFEIPMETFGIDSLK